MELAEAVASCDVVLLAVKPNLIASVTSAEGVDLKGKLVISIAAGISLSSLQQCVGHQCNYIGLRNSLTLTDRQSAVFVRPTRQRFVNKQMPRHIAHPVEYLGLPDTRLFQTSDQPVPRAGRGHTYALQIS